MKKVLILSNVWVEPKSSAAGWRMLRIIDLFLSESYEVHYASTAAHSGFELSLEGRGVITHSIQVNDDAFDSWISELNPDVVLFDRFMAEEQFGWRVSKHCPDALRILDTEDLHALRYAREAAMKEGQTFELEDLHRDILYREMASVYRCDCSLIISSFEMGLLTDFLGVSSGLLIYLPFFVEKAEVEGIESMPDFNERIDFISIGNFRHGPNLDAVKLLREEVWPKIRASLPVAKLKVYGAYPSSQANQFHNPDGGFHVLGRTESVEEVMKSARVLLAPLRYGAGLKGKLLDALRFGLPSATTSIGAEGMRGNFNWPGAVEDDWEAFADAAVEIYSDANVWRQKRNEIRALVSNVYAKRIGEEELLQLMADWPANRTKKRQANWMGQMLNLHTTKSYEHLSKWIMAKNLKA